MATYDSPQKSEEDDGGPRFKKVGIDIGESPTSTPHSLRTFNPGLFSESPDKEAAIKQSSFRLPGTSFDTSFEESKQDISQPSLPAEMEKTTVEEESPATQRPGFRVVGINDDDLVGKAQSLLNTDSSQKPSTSTALNTAAGNDDDYFKTLTQAANCPMCGECVDPAELRAFGHMNTRKQEKFCRSHRKKTALENWDLQQYPEIDWKKLDSRISKHHSFIKKLINGADSHFRDRLAETVNAGKNRSLMKSDFNPTPGYYGTRGLRAISENTMRKFTPLLKQRMVIDRLMAARGFTPYVEYVVVPEVAVKLIMEDMRVDAEKAREIMAESIAAGELLSEEIRDVISGQGAGQMQDSGSETDE